MPKTKAQKKEIIQDLKTKLGEAASAVFVNFSGISVKEIDQFRQNCQNQEAAYLVIKKNLFQKALTETNYSEQSPEEFSGEFAGVFGFGDEIAPAKLTADFAKDHEQFKVLGGIFEGEFIGIEEVAQWAKLPSHQELLAKTVGSISAPLSGLVNVFSGGIRNLLGVLNNLKESKQ